MKEWKDITPNSLSAYGVIPTRGKLSRHEYDYYADEYERTTVKYKQCHDMNRVWYALKLMELYGILGGRPLRNVSFPGPPRGSIVVG